MSQTSTTLLAGSIHESARAQFATLVVVGVGLIGGSVALAARKQGVVRQVIGVGRSASRLERALKAGVLDSTCTDLSAAAAKADLLIFATPVNMIADGVREAASVCRPGTLLSDVGSTKANLCRNLSGGLPEGVTFIGSHPLAGSEKQGWEHACADLFENRVCVVTPTELSPRDQIARLIGFWQALGMTVLESSPEMHDRALAQTSHVPHVVASALARTLDAQNRPLAATGFSDTTRIAAGDPNVWLPILLDNRDAILAGLDDFSTQLNSIREALAKGNSQALLQLWEEGKAIREQLNARHSSG